MIANRKEQLSFSNERFGYTPVRNDRKAYSAKVWDLLVTISNDFCRPLPYHLAMPPQRDSRNYSNLFKIF
ncbi:hypothetical protein HUN01_28525 [Nostoc edaphicum CCNP1411]|uniref:Uncharacterized protein n=1 Tax=Nostoc edaphicum CCNP1411 TaxID=1472755 RepID=A0A7D7LGW1_9NOSO|nr:hypothetical protein [Nostoc edaphicum]QMS91350.1 hypothetical protein HUN01_28525 [Nostoc edaphicum CCNP1411]